MKWYSIGKDCGRGILGWLRRINQDEFMPPQSKHLWFPYRCVRRTWWQETPTGIDAFQRYMNRAPRWASNRHNRLRHKVTIEREVEQQLDSWRNDVVILSTKRV